MAGVSRAARSRRRGLLGRDAAGDAGRRAAHAHRAHARRASRASPTCWSATCGCARASRTWNSRYATPSMRTRRSQHSANDAHPPRDHSARWRRRRRARISPGQLEWKVAGPDDHAGFLRGLLLLRARAAEDRPNVPQGLIHSSWGGTRIETWLSTQALRQLGGNDDKLDLLGRVRQQSRRRGGAVGQANGSSGGWRSRRLAAVQPWARGQAPPASGSARPRELTQWEDLGRAGAGRIRRHDVVSRAREAQRRAGEAGARRFRSA